MERLEREPPDHPLRRLAPLELRRHLASAAWREIRKLQQEIQDESERRR